jgi:phosphatidylglycerophosphate synthase
VRTVRRATSLGALGTPVLLGVLSLTAGLGTPGWVVGLLAGWALTALVVAGRIRSGDRAVLPADWVTLTRALLGAGVAALVADSAGSAGRPLAVPALITLAAVALALDAVDGQVARRTRTATPFGARLDGEVDAFLILVLSVAVSRDLGSWVLAIGAARYALLVAGWAVRWLAAPLPPRYWRKVVAAVQGVVLTVAASGWLPRPVGMVAVGIALALLAESFGRDVLWLYGSEAGPRTRLVLRRATALAAAAVVWAALVAPDRLDRYTPAAFARIPVEGLVLVGIVLLLPTRPRRVVAAAAGALLGALTVVKVFDLGFRQQIGRPFEPVLDWGNVAPAVGVVEDSIGTAATVVVVVLAGLALLLVVAVLVASVVRVSTVTARHRRRSAQGVAVLGGAWALSAVLSLQLVPATPVASASTAVLAVAHVRSAEAAVQDQQRFAATIQADDPQLEVPDEGLLAALRGKDVVIAFVESYGQVAVQGTDFSSGVGTVLRAGTSTLAGAGFSARSAFLDSPTFGGVSWLAHATLQSGLWVSDQQRHDQLMTSDRLTLTSAFGRAGWRTVSVSPSNDRPWPEGTSFYRYDQIYDQTNLGYQGPSFSYASMPDQYTLAAFQRLELTSGHRPVMAEIDLVSSHAPWTPIPTLVPWDSVGDGSVFDPMPAQGLDPDEAWQDTETVRRLYGESIEYTLQTLVEWVAGLHDDDLVLVVLGDHQPAATVSGADANHQVPVSVVAADPAVFSAIDSWQWQDGLLPGPTAPVWPMDAFRDRFLDAFGGIPADLALTPPR